MTTFVQTVARSSEATYSCGATKLYSNFQVIVLVFRSNACYCTVLIQSLPTVAYVQLSRISMLSVSSSFSATAGSRLLCSVCILPVMHQTASRKLVARW